MIIFEVLKYKVWKLATSHSTHSISSRPAEIRVFTSLEKNLQSHFSEHWRALRLQRKCPTCFNIEVAWWLFSVISVYRIQQKVRNEQLTVMDMLTK